jgi:hypothetical protein
LSGPGGRHAKIRNLENTLKGDQDICRLDVQVNESRIMNIS